ncbi:ATP-binding protein [Pontibacter silvestris]|uniref:histidine kinase n=1 Tax=Pontibacter silvestris TaxID=2305183 RepID=A0ABW4WXX7_9BACT|nr:ATP-binding protein [Pontibacter silvestris]MCC9135274.1 PAS domain-containing protein [Pontibacter silvestris]
MNSEEVIDNQQELLLKLKETQRQLEEKNKQLELINQIGSMLTSELELEKVVQNVTDIATKLSKAQFGALFYNKENEKGEEYLLYALSGASKDDFAHLPVLRVTPMLAPTFSGEGVIRSDDITKDPRYGRNKPHRGMPKGHLPVKSYMALPVVSKKGKVLGGLFFGHSKSGVFTQNEENLVLSIAAQAAVAIDNAHLYEAKLQAEQRVKRVLESIPQMAWTSLPDGFIDYFNERWYAYTGQSFDQAKGNGWENIVHPDDIAHVNDVWQKALKNGETFELGSRLRGVADNSYRWHLTRAVPVKDEKGKIQLWVGTSTDVDDYKTTQETLLQKNKELEKINKDLDSFVYTASHDLKAPVINIMQILEELKVSGIYTTDDTKIFVNLLDKSLNQLHSTIDDLSALVKVQKNINATVEYLSLKDIVEEVKLSLNEEFYRSGAKVLLELDEVPTVPFSKANLRSVLFNLISNSVKYCSPDRTPEIVIKSAAIPGYYQISVSDNGLGLDLETQKGKLFQMFRRFHDHVAGSGIGLYIVNRIIENQGGYIEVTSAVNKGTTFNLFIKKEEKK